jgi:hypothetical protein
MYKPLLLRDPDGQIVSVPKDLAFWFSITDASDVLASDDIAPKTQATIAFVECLNILVNKPEKFLHVLSQLARGVPASKVNGFEPGMLLDALAYLNAAGAAGFLELMKVSFSKSLIPEALAVWAGVICEVVEKGQYSALDKDMVGLVLTECLGLNLARPACEYILRHLLDHKQLTGPLDPATLILNLLEYINRWDRRAQISRTGLQEAINWQIKLLNKLLRTSSKRKRPAAVFATQKKTSDSFLVP